MMMLITEGSAFYVLLEHVRYLPRETFLEHLAKNEDRSSYSWHFLHARCIISPDVQILVRHMFQVQLKQKNADPIVDKTVTNRSRRVLPNILFSTSRSIASAFSRFRNVCVNHALINFRYFRD